MPEPHEQPRADAAVLAMDTASQEGAVAVVRGGTVLAERRWPITTTYSRELLAAIDAVLVLR